MPWEPDKPSQNEVKSRCSSYILSAKMISHAFTKNNDIMILYRRGKNIPAKGALAQSSNGQGIHVPENRNRNEELKTFD